MRKTKLSIINCHAIQKEYDWRLSTQCYYLYTYTVTTIKFGTPTLYFTSVTKPNIQVKYRVGVPNLIAVTVC